MRVLHCSLFVVALATAAIACEENDTAAIDGKCREFQVCKNGEWVKDSCNTPLRKYSKEQKKCMWWFQVDCQELSQCSEDGALLKNPYTCSSYYQCQSGKLVEKHCIWPWSFDGSKCTFWGNCDSAVSQGPSATNANEPYAEPCSGDDSEPVANSCLKYKECSDGFFRQTRCGWWKDFNVATKSCEWFWKVDCTISKCDGKAHADPNSDGKTYYECVNDFLMKKTCGMLQKFDEEQGRCVFSLHNIKFDQMNEAMNNITDVLTSNATRVNSTRVSSRNSTGVSSSNSTGVSIKRVLRSVSSSYLMDTSCTEGSYFTDLNCVKYKVCQGNKWITKTCPLGMIFSKGTCQFEWDATCDQGSCITGQSTPYPADCTKYYYCDENNKQILEDCPTFLSVKGHFDPQTQQCRKVWPGTSCPSPSSYLFVNCVEGDTKASSDPTEFQICHNQQWSTVRCTGGDVFTKELGGCGCSHEAQHKPALNSPQEYLECQGGRWVQLDCLLGGVFNPLTNMCEKKASKVKRSVDLDVKNDEDCTTGQTKADIIPGVCSTYMFCNNSKWVRRACLPGEYYSSQSGCSKELCPYSPVLGDCEAFTMASGMKSKCDFGMRFDTVTRQCVTFARAKCAEVECEGLEKKNHPNSCFEYLQCSNQQWDAENCDWFHNKFDMNRRNCVFGWLDGIWGNAVTCRYDPVDCDAGQIKGVSGQPRDYLTCKVVGGSTRQVLDRCWWPMKFDTEQSQCVWWGARTA